MSNCKDIVRENINLTLNNLNLKNFDLFKKSLDALTIENTIFELSEYSNEEINEGLEYLLTNMPLFSDEEKLAFYTHKSFSSNSLSNILSDKELEFLLELLMENEEIDISQYEDILKLNYKYKYKAKIDKLLERKNVNKINVIHKSNSHEFLYKLFLSIMNNKVLNYYRFNSKEYFTNLAKQKEILAFLSSIGYKNITNLLEDSLKTNDYKSLFDLTSTIKLKNSELNKLIDILSSNLNVTYDLSKVEFIKEDKISFKEFSQRESLPSETLKQALNLINEYLSDDILTSNLNFNNVLKNTKNLDLLLLNLREIFKTYGFNIDINYIKGNLDDLDFVKELYILKTLYYLILLMNEKNIDSTKLENKEELLKLLSGEFEFSNIAEKLLPNSVTKLDLYNILLILDGSKELNVVPLKDEFYKELESTNLADNYTFKERFDELTKDSIFEDKVKNFKEYFTDLKKLKYMSNLEIEVEIERQMYNMMLQINLNFYDVESGLEGMIDLIKGLKDTINKDTCVKFERMIEDKRTSIYEGEIETTNKAIEVIKEYNDKVKYISNSLEELLVKKALIDENKDYIIEDDIVSKAINDSIEKLCRENEKLRSEQSKIIAQEERKGIKIDLDELSNHRLVKTDDFNDFLVFNHDDNEREK